ncbi:MAG: hypothetical protein ABSF50_06195 [Burkholderiaceae bacterium]|jgi:hypothetical protein
MALVHKIQDHILIPFGGSSASVGDISVVGVSTTGLFFESELPLAYVRKAEHRGLRLRDFPTVVAGEWPELAEDAMAWRFLENQLILKCDPNAPLEQWFIELYFNYCRAAIACPSSFVGLPLKQRPDPFNSPRWIFDALMPLPQAHIYDGEPSEKSFTFSPAKFIKVGFCFWTGRRIFALEIDDPRRSDGPSRAEKDARLTRAGVSVIHLALDEVKHPEAQARIGQLPDEITHFWMFAETLRRQNPFDYAAGA